VTQTLHLYQQLILMETECQMLLMLIPSSPETSNDSETRSVDDTIEIDILSKDDYLPNNNSDSFGRVDIVQTGGDALGIIVFDLLTGILYY
jgi:hypothetical protein